MKMIYNVNDKPKFLQLIVFAIQQLLAIMAATLVVPVIVGNGMQPSAALFGAGVGTIVYVLFTKAKSPVFLGSSFAFLGSMAAAFAGAVSVQLGYLGLIIGAACAGLVYVIIAIIVKLVGVNWINKLMPAVVIGPTVAIIGLSLAGNAIGDLMKTKVADAEGNVLTSPYVALVCGLVTLAVTMVCSTYGKKMMKLIPFVIGILAGYATGAIFTVIGTLTNNDALKVIDFSIFASMNSIFTVPEFTFLTAIKGVKDFDLAYLATVAVAYVPVAFVVFAEHIADHKNLSTIIEKDLLEEPGLHRTLLGDGIGSVAGAIFGGCPNTTYGESVGCVAITRNCSVITIITAAIGAILIAFINPFVVFVNSIPSCVMGGVCMALYGFIAVSGLKMIQKVDLEKNRNLFVVSVILIAGIGGLTLTFGKVTLTSIACALILGILTNVLLSGKNADAE
ncbi:MAG: uracil-xanthine permease [Clostridia bacterium]|nr:uracil-xanthine permease [Clostridia bacterium]MBQ2274741.1 uracil-xanthine permease [Clostridia bacterium]MBQ5798927.1 uracil-xanthine permease [Clostridia bacterium]MBQ5901438.1 uracil-xanthine permease [Clostridia bacterium]MEE1279106.1 solute carrier family 23 protein [Acutalibacteraceae bacterium]